MCGVVNGCVCDIRAIYLKQYNINSKQTMKDFILYPQRNVKETRMQNVVAKKASRKIIMEFLKKQSFTKGQEKRKKKTQKTDDKPKSNHNTNYFKCKWNNRHCQNESKSKPSLYGLDFLIHGIHYRVKCF